MKKLRKHAVIAIDGGGIRGTMIARALAALEENKAFGDKTCDEVFELSAGTSTGSIISAGLAAGMSGGKIYRLYTDLGPRVFAKTLRSFFWFLCSYRYPPDDLEQSLRDHLDGLTLKDLKTTDLVMTAFDLVENRTLFVKTGKKEYDNWELVKAVMSSCAVPTYFPPAEGRYIDGGVGSYANPCYLAAYEACIVKKWKPAETTLISLGTGRDPYDMKAHRADRYNPLQWVDAVFGVFLQSAADQQVRLVKTFFEKLDFRRFQVDFKKAIPMDDASPAAMQELKDYGDVLASKIMKDETDKQAEEGAYKLPRGMK
ncbi:MAG: patatin-like phospholipase family protein [Spirochaetales bacterium]|nr:patatin-like phospholipase family protein [Spirochaetales bacterium]